MFVFSNLATSIDGKIATVSRVHFPLGTPADHKLMKKLRSRADAAVIGAGTLRAYHGPLLASAGSKPPLNVVVSSGLEGLSPQWDFFTDRRTQKILFVSARAPEARVSRFAKAIGESGQVFRLKTGIGLAAEIIRHLDAVGVRRLLVEGGGGLMWDFIRPNLIDEIYLTLTPRVIGGTHAPSLVDGAGFAPREVLHYKLRSCRRLGDELYLIYRKPGRSG